MMVVGWWFVLGFIGAVIMTAFDIYDNQKEAITIKDLLLIVLFTCGGFVTLFSVIFVFVCFVIPDKINEIEIFNKFNSKVLFKFREKKN
jgi:hypothetical protein